MAAILQPDFPQINPEPCLSFYTYKGMGYLSVKAKTLLLTRVGDLYIDYGLATSRSHRGARFHLEHGPCLEFPGYVLRRLEG